MCTGLPDHADGQLPLAATLDADQTRHARKVLRLGDGDAVQLLDGNGRVARATLVGDDPRSGACSVSAVDLHPKPTPTIELATAIPKGPRADAMVNDLAQLGVDRLIPLITERSVVEPRGNKLDRFAKAGAEAAKQSGRAWFMQINPATPFDEALECNADLKLVADPNAQPLDGLAKRFDTVNTVRILIGPEGGLTGDELAAARDAGFIPWRFSPNVLRVETAAAAAVAILRAQA